LHGGSKGTKRKRPPRCPLEGKGGASHGRGEGKEMVLQRWAAWLLQLLLGLAMGEGGG
jgi:hypothetical protein